MNLFKAPIQKTCGGYTAEQLIDSAKIIKTQSNDYYLRTGSLDLDLTDEYDLVVSGYGQAICVMIISSDYQDKMIAAREKIESLYERDQAAL